MDDLFETLTRGGARGIDDAWREARRTQEPCHWDRVDALLEQGDDDPLETWEEVL